MVTGKPTGDALRDRLVDLRVDDNVDPLGELRRLLIPGADLPPRRGNAGLLLQRRRIGEPDIHAQRQHHARSQIAHAVAARPSTGSLSWELLASGNVLGNKGSENS